MFWRWPRWYSWSLIPTSSSTLFVHGIFGVVYSLFANIWTQNRRARKIYDSRDKMKISKYRFWPVCHIENPGITHLLEYTKLGVYAFGSMWEKQDEADKKRSSHNREPLLRSLCCMKISFKHIAAIQHAIKLRLLFAAFNDILCIIPMYKAGQKEREI